MQNRAGHEEWIAFLIDAIIRDTTLSTTKPIYLNIFGAVMKDYLLKRLIMVLTVVLSLGYTLAVGLAPWVLIIWFLFYR